MDMNNLTLANPTLSSFFLAGTGEYPIEEIKFLLDHPLIRPSVITEITEMVENITVSLVPSELGPMLSNKVVDIMNQLVRALSSWENQEESALVDMCDALRSAVQFCQSVNALMP